MNLRLRLLNDPVLREPTQPVNPEDLAEIKSVLQEMETIMKAEGGAALAANQVGISKRFFIMPVDNVTRVFINPEIVDLGDVAPFEEGCLSIPGTSAQTMRAQRVKVKYLDENLDVREVEYQGITAVAIQHEVDHLDGKLYIDQLPTMRRMLMVDRHRKFLKMRSRRR